MDCQEIDQLIEESHLLKHEFYQAWNKGLLSKKCLKEYALNYYHHVKAFPRYLSAVHANCEEESTRRILLENLVEEEGGSPNHPMLWRQFCHSLGATEEEIDAHKPIGSMKDLVDMFFEISKDGSTEEGVAALYAYESQIPEISRSKIDGLVKFYEMKDPKDWQYFAVHIEADELHRQEERALLDKFTDNVEASKDAVKAVLQKLNQFLTEMLERHPTAA